MPDTHLSDTLDALISGARDSRKAGKEMTFREMASVAKLDPAVDFRNGTFVDIDLRDEDLSGFDFSGADLTGADFRRATGLTAAALEGACLLGAIGISDEIHRELEAMEAARGAGEAPFRTGVPENFRRGDAPVEFEVRLDDGRLTRAIVDASAQYRDEGLRWAEVETRRSLPWHRVVGWREAPATEPLAPRP